MWELQCKHREVRCITESHTMAQRDVAGFPTRLSLLYFCNQRSRKTLSLYILNITEPYNSYGDTRKTTPRQGRVPTEPCSQHRAYTGTNVVGERVQQMVKIWGRAATSKTPESHIGESALPCRADGADPPGKKWSSSWRYTAKYSRGGRQVQGRADTKVYKMW